MMMLKSIASVSNDVDAEEKKYIKENEVHTENHSDEPTARTEVRSIGEVKLFLEHFAIPLNWNEIFYAYFFKPISLVYNIIFIIINFVTFLDDLYSDNNESYSQYHLRLGSQIASIAEFAGLFVISVLVISSIILNWCKKSDLSNKNNNNASIIDSIRLLGHWSTFKLSYMLRPVAIWRHLSDIYKNSTLQYLKRQLKYYQNITKQLKELVSNEEENTSYINVNEVKDYQTKFESILNNDEEEQKEEKQEQENEDNKGDDQEDENEDHKDHEDNNDKTDEAQGTDDVDENDESEESDDMKQAVFFLRYVANIVSCLIVLLLFLVGIIAVILKLSQFSFITEKSMIEWNFYQWFVLLGFCNQLWSIVNVDAIRVNTFYNYLFVDIGSIDMKPQITRDSQYYIMALDCVIKNGLTNKKYGIKGWLLAINIQYSIIMKILIKNPYETSLFEQIKEIKMENNLSKQKSIEIKENELGDENDTDINSSNITGQMIRQLTRKALLNVDAGDTSVQQTLEMGTVGSKDSNNITGINPESDNINTNINDSEHAHAQHQNDQDGQDRDENSQQEQDVDVDISVSDNDSVGNPETVENTIEILGQLIKTLTTRLDIMTETKAIKKAKSRKQKIKDMKQQGQEKIQRFLNNMLSRFQLSGSNIRRLNVLWQAKWIWHFRSHKEMLVSNVESNIDHYNLILMKNIVEKRKVCIDDIVTINEYKHKVVMPNNKNNNNNNNNSDNNLTKTEEKLRLSQLAAESMDEIANNSEEIAFNPIGHTSILIDVFQNELGKALYTLFHLLILATVVLPITSIFFEDELNYDKIKDYCPSHQAKTNLDAIWISQLVLSGLYLMYLVCCFLPRIISKWYKCGCCEILASSGCTIILITLIGFCIVIAGMLILGYGLGVYNNHNNKSENCFQHSLSMYPLWNINIIIHGFLFIMYTLFIIIFIIANWTIWVILTFCYYGVVLLFYGGLAIMIPYYDLNGLAVTSGIKYVTFDNISNGFCRYPWFLNGFVIISCAAYGILIICWILQYQILVRQRGICYWGWIVGKKAKTSTHEDGGINSDENYDYYPIKPAFVNVLSVFKCGGNCQKSMKNRVVYDINGSEIEKWGLNDTLCHTISICNMTINLFQLSFIIFYDFIVDIRNKNECNSDEKDYVKTTLESLYPCLIVWIVFYIINYYFWLKMKKQKKLKLFGVEIPKTLYAQFIISVENRILGWGLMFLFYIDKVIQSYQKAFLTKELQLLQTIRDALQEIYNQFDELEKQDQIVSTTKEDMQTMWNKCNELERGFLQLQ